MVQLNGSIAQRVVNRIASGLGRPISITNIHGTVLASTNQTSLAAQIPCAMEAISTGQLCREANSEDAILCVPLLYGTTTLGAIVLHHVASDDRDYQDIARVSQTLAELVIYQSTVIEHLPQQRWVYDKFVHDLLHGQFHGSPETMLQEASLFGIDLHVPRIVALVDIEPLMVRAHASLDADTPSVTRRLRIEQVHEQLLEQAQQTTRAHNGDVYSFIDDHRLIILPVIDPEHAEACHKQVVQNTQNLLSKFAQSFETAVGAGVGRYYPGWQTLGESFKDAQFTFETGVALYGHGRVFCVANLGLAGMLWSDTRKVKVELAQRLLQPLIDEYELWHTLEAFLQANLSPSQTARVLHIHRHTLAYRLDKIAQLTGLDPRRFSSAAQLQAAIILHKLHRATTT